MLLATFLGMHLAQCVALPKELHFTEEEAINVLMSGVPQNQKQSSARLRLIPR